MIALSRALLVLAALMVLLLAGFILFWVKPQELGMSAPEAWASFQGGSIFGITLWSIPWLAGTAAAVLVGFLRLGRRTSVSSGEKIVRGLKWCLFAAGVAALLSVLPYVPVDLALEHVVPWERRSSASEAPFGALLCAGMLAVGAAGVLHFSTGARNKDPS